MVGTGSDWMGKNKRKRSRIISLPAYLSGIMALSKVSDQKTFWVTKSSNCFLFRCNVLLPRSEPKFLPFTKRVSPTCMAFTSSITGTKFSTNNFHTSRAAMMVIMYLLVRKRTNLFFHKNLKIFFMILKYIFFAAC